MGDGCCKRWENVRWRRNLRLAHAFHQGSRYLRSATTLLEAAHFLRLSFLSSVPLFTRYFYFEQKKTGEQTIFG